MNKTIFYDRDNDILAVHKGFSKDEKFKGNIDVGDLILDMSTKERVKGLEIINASTYLEPFSISKKKLEAVEDIDFSASIKPDSITLAITIKTSNPKEEKPVRIAIPLSAKAQNF